MKVELGLSFWLTNWNWQPGILIGTALLLSGYFYAIGPLRRKYKLASDDEVDSGQTMRFVLGVSVIFLSLFSALDALGDTYLFSAHMLQHLLITLIGPPLILTGIPTWLIDPLLKKAWIRKPIAFFTHPVAGGTLFTLVFWLWHAPQLYSLALQYDSIHLLEHMMFMGSAMLFWWPIFSPSNVLPQMSMGKQILYIFLSGMPTVLLGAGLTFSKPLYDPYIFAPRVYGLSAEVDQQLGGLLMWVPGQLFFIAVMSGIFIRGLMRSERKQRQLDQLLAERQL